MFSNLLRTTEKQASNYIISKNIKQIKYLEIQLKWSKEDVCNLFCRDLYTELNMFVLIAHLKSIHCLQESRIIQWSSKLLHNKQNYSQSKSTTIVMLCGVIHDLVNHVNVPWNRKYDYWFMYRSGQNSFVMKWILWK